MGDPHSQLPSGAYGLRLRGVDPASPLLVAATAQWDRMEIVRRRGHVPLEEAALGHRVAGFPLLGGGRLVVERDTKRAVFTTADALSDSQLIHPYLAPAAALFARWRRDEAFHAGGFLHGGRVWALLGDRESGKSSTLAWLAGMGFDIVCDDLLIVHSGMAYAGPRCIDLRESSAQRLDIHDRFLRERTERWRMVVPQVPAELPMGGWIFLEWAPQVSATKIPATERLSRLATHRSILLKSTNPSALLEAAVLPAWRLTRPRTWESIGSAAQQILELTNR